MKTLRGQIIELLREEEMSVRDLSKTLHIMEKDVFDHLAHITRTLKGKGDRLIVSPYRCLSCGYEFKKRKKLSRPGRCPECRNSHLQQATFRIV